MPKTSMDIRSRFGQEAARLRGLLGISARKQAKKMGVSYQYIYLMETNRTTVPINMLRTYMTFFKEAGASEEDLRRLMETAVDETKVIYLDESLSYKDKLGLIKLVMDSFDNPGTIHRAAKEVLDHEKDDQVRTVPRPRPSRASRQRRAAESA